MEKKKIKVRKWLRDQLNNKWCMANGIKYADEAYEKGPEYGKWLVEQGRSAWTVQTAICAIAKAYGV